MYCTGCQQALSHHHVSRRGRITHESRVHESHSRLANLETLVVDPRQNGSEYRARSAGASDDGRRAFVEDDDVVAYRGDVGVPAAGAVVYYRSVSM